MLPNIKRASTAAVIFTSFLFTLTSDRISPRSLDYMLIFAAGNGYLFPYLGLIPEDFLHVLAQSVGKAFALSLLSPTVEI